MMLQRWLFLSLPLFALSQHPCMPKPLLPPPLLPLPLQATLQTQQPQRHPLLLLLTPALLSLDGMAAAAPQAASTLLLCWA